jgi:hypothetical protein
MWFTPSKNAVKPADVFALERTDAVRGREFDLLFRNYTETPAAPLALTERHRSIQVLPDSEYLRLNRHPS